MREILLSTNEKNFVLKAIKQNRRLDGRKNNEFRPVKISFGSELGSVLVALGESRVLAHITSEISEPKATRPNEGILYINVELGPMAAPHFEAGRNNELTVRLNRTLERTFKDSRCIDLESLCIISEEKVWTLRVDLNVLNHEGNLFDCCSVATLCALAHFRRPDVSIRDNEICVHPASEKEPLPMVMHHFPVCVSYAIFDDGRIVVADPTVLEERTSESHMIFGINSYQELCCLNLGGAVLNSSLILLQTVKEAAVHAKKVVDLVKKSLAKDLSNREAGKVVGFSPCEPQNAIVGSPADRLALKLRNFSFNCDETEGEQDIEMLEETEQLQGTSNANDMMSPHQTTNDSQADEKSPEVVQNVNDNIWITEKCDSDREKQDNVISSGSDNEVQITDVKASSKSNHKDVISSKKDNKQRNDSIVSISDSDDQNPSRNNNNDSSSDVTIVNTVAISDDSEPILVDNSGSGSEEEEVLYIASN